MSERRYSEDEVAEILDRATEANTPGGGGLTSGGMSLAELQDIGDEVGIPREVIARAAATTGAGDAHDGERSHYLCAAIRSAILPSVSDYLDSGERAGRHWYAGHKACPVDFSDQPQCFNNYNQPG